jgi:hypothetical protein
MILLEIHNLSSQPAISNNFLPKVGVVAVIVGAIIAILFGTLALLHHSKSSQSVWAKTWSYIERHLSLWFFIVLLMGFATYCVGMMTYKVTELNYTNIFLSIVAVSPHAIVHAFGMFLLQSDVSEIHDQCFNNCVFMTGFSAVHALAAFISMVFVLKHFGYNIISKIRLRYATTFGKKIENLYMFWGMNEPSYLLAKDIIKHGKCTKSKILFINSSDTSEAKESIVGMDRLFSFLSYKNKELDRFKELDCLIANTFHRLSKAEANQCDQGQRQILRKELQLSLVVKLIQRTIGDIHIFLLGDDRLANIQAVGNLCQDSSIVNAAANQHKVNIYCGARNSSVIRAIENDLSTENINIHIIDESHDSINELKSDQQFHPINFVDIDTKDNLGTVKSPFNCMIIGFGETGQDALRFLYEFGAFVDSTSDKEDDVKGILPNGKNALIIRSQFHCDIVDPRIDHIAGHVFANAQAMDKIPSPHNADDSAPRQSMMTLHNFDTQSKSFYELVHANANKWNYIVISTGNDDDNITIAVRLFNKIRIARKNLDKLIILVRCYSSEHAKYLQGIANYYNEGATSDAHIVIFGTTEHIYTYDQIIENTFEQRGKDYNEMYCKINPGSKLWKDRHDKLIKMGTLDGYSELRRKESQDIANAYHSITKSIILKSAYTGEHTFSNLLTIVCSDGHQCNFCRSQSALNNITAPIRIAHHDLSEREHLLLLNLARTEHLRWNASHEVLGYLPTADYINTYGNDFSDDPYELRHTCDERRKTHNCIIPWEDLDKESCDSWQERQEHSVYKEFDDYKRYDYCVVATTIAQWISLIQEAEDNRSDNNV